MKILFPNLAIAAIAGLLVLGAGTLASPPSPALADANAVTFPPLDQLVHDTTVRRGVTREQMLTSSEALAAFKAGQPVPTGNACHAGRLPERKRLSGLHERK